MAGYSGTPLLKKLGIKENFKLYLINAPEHIKAILGELPPGAKWVKKPSNASLGFILGFAKDKATLIQAFRLAKPLLVMNGMLWLCWPKGKSKIISTINREDVREEGLACGLVDIKVAAIDEDWSGLKFVYRVKDRK